MTAEAITGRAGGIALREKYGIEYMRELGAKGKEFGKLGGRPRKSIQIAAVLEAAKNKKEDMPLEGSNNLQELIRQWQSHPMYLRFKGDTESPIAA